jgi:hypothetical protein
LERSVYGLSIQRAVLEVYILFLLFWRDQLLSLISLSRASLFSFPRVSLPRMPYDPYDWITELEKTYVDFEWTHHGREQYLDRKGCLHTIKQIDQHIHLARKDYIGYSIVPDKTHADR